MHDGEDETSAGTGPDLPRTRRRRHDGAVILPVFAALLFLPPFIGLFARPVTLFGLPLIVIWLFGIWLGLIAVAWRLSRLLSDGEGERGGAR